MKSQLPLNILIRSNCKIKFQLFFSNLVVLVNNIIYYASAYIDLTIKHTIALSNGFLLYIT